MSRYKKIVLIMAVLALIASTLVACDFSNDSGNSDSPIQKIVIGTTAQIEKAVRDEYAYDTLASGVSELALISKSANGEYSSLIVDFSTTDSLSWTYTIKDGFKWSDGVEVSAQDIVFSLEYEQTESQPAFSNGETKGTYSSYVLSNDNKSVTLTLEKANVKALDEMTTFRIRPKHVYEGKTSDQISKEDGRVSLGPYVLSSFDKSANTLTFTQNEHYPQKPNVGKVVYKLFANEDVMYTALVQGDLDMVWNYSQGVPSTYQDLLAKSDDVVLESVNATNCPAMLTFNNKTGLGADKNVRYAISYALDYQTYKNYFGSEYANLPNASFVSSAHVGYVKTETLEKNVAKASEYMNLAGYQKAGDFWQKDGKDASLTLTVNANKVQHVGYAEFVKTQLEEFGIKVVLDSVDSTHYNEKTSQKFASEGGHQYGKITMESAIMGYTAYGMSDLGAKYINGNNKVQGGAQVYDDNLNEIIRNMESAKTIDEYKTYAKELQEFYAEQRPAIALYWDSYIYAHTNAYSGFSIDATFGLNCVNTWFTIAK